MNASGPGASRVQDLFTLLSLGDTDGAVAQFTADVEMEVPFQPQWSGFWPRTSGRPALARFLGSVPTLFEGFSLELTHVYPIDDANWVVVRYRSDALVRATGRRYQNTYLGVFGLAPDGRIREWTEFHDPRVLLQAFDLESGHDGNS